MKYEYLIYRFLNIWPKCEVVAAAAATRPFKTELVGHWRESNLAAAHQTTAAVFEPQRRKKNYIVASTRTSACSTEPWQTQPRTSKKGGENLTPPLSSTVPQFLQKTNKTKIVYRTYGKTVMIFIFRYDFKCRY